MKGFGKKKRKAAGESKGDFAAAMRPWLTVAATLTVAGGLAIGVLVGVPLLQGKLSDQASARPVRVAFEWPRLGAAPGKESKSGDTWLPDIVQQDLLAAAKRELDRDPDPYRVSALQRVAELAAGSGWFEQITAVRREPGGLCDDRGPMAHPRGRGAHRRHGPSGRTQGRGAPARV
jgi:hypothetical protein